MDQPLCSSAGGGDETLHKWAAEGVDLQEFEELVEVVEGGDLAEVCECSVFIPRQQVMLHYATGGLRTFP